MPEKTKKLQYAPTPSKAFTVAVSGDRAKAVYGNQAKKYSTRLIQKLGIGLRLKKGFEI